MDPRELKNTLNLPDADFTIPMKADLPVREPQQLAAWQAMDIYGTIQDARANAPEFVLHDGPPYTNSPIHIGTAMNKVLKDFVVKSRTMMGLRCPYVPGFDNHGLPIEQSVAKAFAERKETPDTPTFRAACREHARHYCGVQSEQFQRLGVFGLWSDPYTTMNYRFEAEIVRVFKRLIAANQVYKGLRPVLWSPTSRTALADTEIVYHDHVSRAITVTFPLQEDPHGFFSDYESVACVIWTTTPWTIPANVAVAFGPELEYALVRDGERILLMLDARVEAVMADVGATGWERIGLVPGRSMEGCVFKHPIFDRPSVAVLADYVTTEDGTGVVHTAPGHGREDFITGLKYNLPVLCPVDERGVMTEEAGEFAGLFYTACDSAVVDRLRELGNLLHVQEFTHSYPYAERDGKPVIFRATEQWFVSIDANDLRKLMLEQIDTVQWVPATGENRIRAMITNRPDWCISRQRPWGVGIPVFYGRHSRKPMLDSVAIEAVAELIEREGSDAWFMRPAEEILPPGYVHPDTGETEFDKETDVFDVWFDAGSTNLCVLEGNVNPRWKERWPADLFLEGSDQHRGWFNTSLILGTALRGAAPYRAVVTHGFVVDDKGYKMSKRLGNVIDPVAASNQYGADVVRYWVASVDYTNDAPCTDALLKQCGESYRRIRNTLRFLLANLSDYDPASVAGPEEVDLWMREQLELLTADVVAAYERYDFSSAANAIHQFCSVPLSSFYLDAIKDRIYCDGPDWPSRRAAQATCQTLLIQLVRLIAPVLVFTAEEIYSRIPGLNHLVSVHAETIAVPSTERLAEIAGNPRQVRFAQMLEHRAEVFTAWEQFKGTDGLKDSQDVIAHAYVLPVVAAVLSEFGTDLALLYKFSEVRLIPTEGDGAGRVSFSASPHLKCDRSRLRRADVQAVDGVNLSARDRRALGLEA